MPYKQTAKYSFFSQRIQDSKELLICTLLSNISITFLKFRDWACKRCNHRVVSMTRCEVLGRFSVICTEQIKKKNTVHLHVVLFTSRFKNSSESCLYSAFLISFAMSPWWGEQLKSGKKELGLKVSLMYLRNG